MMDKLTLLVYLGLSGLIGIAALGVAYLCYVIHSIVRIADALERIADALESDDEEGEEQ